MGTVYAEITLKNSYDVMTCKRGYINEQEIRQTTLQAVVDTGAGTLIINEDVRQKLGLEVEGEQDVTMANQTPETCKVTEPVEVHWKNRKMVCQPWVIPGNGEILLGAIPLENMDLIVDPKREEVVGRHGDEPIGLAL
ncbi:MAG: aspartyl protease family protein [Treponema sp.]|jgi:clan AA aspartic protease|nr:aspartyl protease family protein [Treponema sp.]